jgi:hypothetical protein
VRRLDPSVLTLRLKVNGKMEEDVKPEDEDGVGRGICRWNAWVCGLGEVITSLDVGFVRGPGVFTAVLPSFALVSRMSFAQHNHDFGHFFSATSSSRREVMVGGALTRASTFRVGLDVGGAVITPGLRVCPSRSCDGWVCGLGVVGVSLVFGLVRGDGAFAVVLGFSCRLGCQWGYHRVWIVRLSIALVDFSHVDLLFVVRYF